MKTQQFLKKDSVPWNKKVCLSLYVVYASMLVLPHSWTFKLSNYVWTWVMLNISYELKTFRYSSYSIYYARYLSKGGTRWRSSSRHCVTSREVAGSIPDSVIDIFHLHNPIGRTMALESTQPPTGVQELFPWGKEGRCVGLTTLPSSCADCLEIWEPQTPGTLRVCTGIALHLLV
jgi:hypothetical protein